MKPRSARSRILLALGLAGAVISGAMMVYDAATRPAPGSGAHPSMNVSVPFSFLVVGDSAGVVVAFRSLIDRLNHEDARFAVHLGDMVYEGRDYQYRMFLKGWRKLKMPSYTCAGNHDVRIGEKGRENYKKYFGPGDYSFSAGDSYFVMVDSSSEDVTPVQLDRLERELVKGEGYAHRFVFTHVPLFDPRQGETGEGHCLENTGRARAMNAILDRHRVDMIFSGHIHGYYRGVWGRTPYIISGGGGQSLTADTPESRFFNYIRVTVAADRVDYEVVRLTPGFPRQLDQALFELAQVREAFLFPLLLALSLAVTAYAGFRLIRAT